MVARTGRPNPFCTTEDCILKSDAKITCPSGTSTKLRCHWCLPAVGDSNVLRQLPGCGQRFAPDSRKQRRGAAAVELAIVLPILVTVLLGATDFGRYSYSAIAVANAARSGAAYGSMNSFTSGTQATWQAAVQQAALDELSGSAAFDTSKLTITVISTTEASGLRRVSVQTTYPFKTIVNWSYIPSSFNLQQTVVMRGIR
jgi:Flp pilus assembly protein TadG